MITDKEYERIVNDVAATLIRAGSSFSSDKIAAYTEAIQMEENEHTKWVMEKILENATTAEKNRSPLCDDTGIPHIILEVGPEHEVSGKLLSAIKEGVKQGLRQLPGRPMAIKGDDRQRLDQSCGLDMDSGALLPAPIQILDTEEDVLRLHILMQGGGPAIRGKTYRVFHHHSVDNVVNEIIEWAQEGVGMLGCSPCTLAIGIGRSHFEATALMEQAQIFGNYGVQSELEQYITEQVNRTNIGALGLGGNNSVLATFLRVGPQRASGVRIVSLTPCCCFEPRYASIEL